MKGHIRERSPGHWAIVIDVRHPENGKRRRRWHSLRGTKRQAQVECARLIAELRGGAYIDPSKVGLSQYLEQWLAHMRALVSPNTHERYAELVRKSIIPLIGNTNLSKLQALQISSAYSKALAQGRRDGKGGLSQRTVHHMHRVLRQSLQQAVRWQLIARNPTDAVRPPKVDRASMRTLDNDQTAALLETLRPTRMFVPVLLAVLCGLRRGEIVALRWRALDLEARRLAVVASTEQTRAGVREKEPKGRKGRVVDLPSIVVEQLRRHRLRQAEEMLKIGVRQSEQTHIVTRTDGEPLQPRSVTHEWHRLLATNGLPRVRFHDLRHTHASHLLAEGVHPKIVMERLGHSSIGITLDIYSHALPTMQAEAAGLIDEALRAALRRRSRPNG
jgi:integrase